MKTLCSHTRKTFHMPILWALLGLTGLFFCLGNIFPGVGYDFAAWAFLFTSMLFIPQSYQRVLLLYRLHKNKSPEILPADASPEWIKKDEIFLGQAFDWDTDACQKLYDITNHLSESGSNRFHAIKPSHKQYVNKSVFGTHTLIFGTTGAGKTKLCELLTTQFITQKDALIFIDPKGDGELAEALRKACHRAGREQDFFLFSPQKPEQSCRLSICSTVTTPTEMADLVCALLPKGNDVFNSFCWEAIYALSAGLFILGERPSFSRLKELLSEADLAEFVFQVVHQAASNMESTQIEKAQLEAKEAQSPIFRRINVWLNFIQKLPGPPPEGIQNLIKLHNRSEHLQKLIGALDPVLSKLCSGPLPLLFEPSSASPSVNLEEVLRKGLVLYISVDSRNDPTVSRAISTMVLTTLSQLAGRKQSALEQGEKLPKTVLFVDEASEASCDGLITLLNKSRSAGFSLFIATQTIADFISALKGTAEATRVLANANSTIALRSIDAETQKYLVQRLPTVSVLDTQQKHTTDLSTGKTTSTNAFISHDCKLFPETCLGELPPLEGLWINAGKVTKVKFPLLTSK